MAAALFLPLFRFPSIAENKVEVESLLVTLLPRLSVVEGSVKLVELVLLRLLLSVLAAAALLVI